MEKIAIVTDTGSSLSPILAKKNGIYSLPLQIIIDEISYNDILDINTLTIFDKMKNHVMPTTSMPNYLTIRNCFKDIKRQGFNSIIAIPLTAGISNTSLVFESIANEFNIPITVIDVYTTCQLQKYVVLKVKELVDKKYSRLEILNMLQPRIDHSVSMIFAKDLNYLKRGGRLTPLAASFANMLKIYPLLIMNKDTKGKIDVYAKVRTEKKAKKIAVETILKTRNNVKGKIYILHSSNIADAIEVRGFFIANGVNENEIVIDYLNSVIAVHTGLNCLAIQYIEEI